MSLAMFMPGRTVLLIGDDALNIYDVTAKGVTHVDSVPWQDYDFEDDVAGIIQRDCQGKSLVLLNDMTDQHFKGGQRIPKVGPLDKSKVLQRKIQVAFPNYPIRGALPIKLPKEEQKAARQAVDPGDTGERYLFAATPESEPIRKTIEAAKKSLAQIAGFYLLPAESAGLVETLADKAFGDKSGASKWVVFIGQHKGGGLRQIITRDGQLAMTRMTPILDSDREPEKWAQDVHQDFKATISYLSRFGFSADDGMDVIAIATRECGEQLETLIDVPCRFRSMTVNEAARTAGIKTGTQDDPRYAEPLHVAYAGRKTSFTLPMAAKSLKEIQNPRRMATMAIPVLVVGGLWLAWQLSMNVQTFYEVRAEIDQQRIQLAQARQKEQQAQEPLKEMGIDITLIKAASEAFQNFEKSYTRVMPVIDIVGEALDEGMRLDDIDIMHLDESKGSGIGSEGEVSRKKLRVAIQVGFPGSENVDENVRRVSNFAGDVQAALPSYKVKIERQVAVPRYTLETQGQAGKTSDSRRRRSGTDARKEAEKSAEIIITGPSE